MSLSSINFAAMRNITSQDSFSASVKWEQEQSDDSSPMSYEGSEAQRVMMQKNQEIVCL